MPREYMSEDKRGVRIGLLLSNISGAIHCIAPMVGALSPQDIVDVFKKAVVQV